MSESTAMLVSFYNETGHAVRRATGALVPPVDVIVRLLGRVWVVTRVVVDYDDLRVDVHLAEPVNVGRPIDRPRKRSRTKTTASL